MKQRTIALLGHVRTAEMYAIEEATAAAGVSVSPVERPVDLAPLLEREEPLAILVATESDGAFEACVEVRSKRRYAHVPILGVNAARSNVAFVELYHWGGDDLVALDGSVSLLRRLRTLRAAPPKQASESVEVRGTALVATADVQWGTVLSRALSNAGLRTQFVGNTADAVDQSREARVVIASDDLAPCGAQDAVSAARNQGIDTPWVIVAPPKRVIPTQAAVGRLARVAVVDAFAPPENVLFVANDLARVGIDQRAAPRLLFGTTVAFRVAGREEEDEIGFTYNVSASGLFIRTLAPVEPGEEIWVELWVPRSPRRVRLSGIARWRRAFGPNELATVPPGFGLQLVSGLGGDFDRWRAGCEALENDTHTPMTAPPKGRPSLMSALMNRATV